MNLLKNIINNKCSYSTHFCNTAEILKKGLKRINNTFKQETCNISILKFLDNCHEIIS